MVCPACPDGITRENWRETETGVEAVTGENRQDCQAVLFNAGKSVR